MLWEAEEKEKGSARNDGKGEERGETPAFTLFPSFPTRFLCFFFFLVIAMFIGIPSESFC